MKQEFDANQGHGDHMDCLCGPENTNEFLSQWIPQSITKSGLIGGTKEPVDCDFGDEMPKKMPMNMAERLSKRLTGRLPFRMASVKTEVLT